MDGGEVPLGGRDAAGQDLPGAQRPFVSRDAAPRRRASLRPGRVKSEESAATVFAWMVPLMNETNGSSDQISKTVQTTDEMAFQASLLALSAAVEAAAARRSTETATD